MKLMGKYDLYECNPEGMEIYEVCIQTPVGCVNVTVVIEEHIVVCASWNFTLL